MPETDLTSAVSCPNPRCEARIEGGQTHCSDCGHDLGLCPNCRRTVSKQIGRCAWCGTYLDSENEAQTPPTPVAETPTIIRFWASRDSVRETLAEAYRDAALADAEMASVVHVLEDIRNLFLTERNAFAIWEQLDREVGSADAETLRPALCKVVEGFTSELIRQQRERLAKAFAANAEDGWREWLIVFSEGIAQWRIALCLDLVETPLPFPEEFRRPFEFYRCAQLMLEERWTEMYALFEHLAGLDYLHPNTRALLHVPAGQVQLYHFSDNERALECFEHARQLAPGLGKVLEALGSYYQQTNDPARARTYFEQAINAEPSSAAPYNGLGDLAENPEETRRWYQEATKAAVGDAQGYTRLLGLYGRPEFIDKYGSHIGPLAHRAIDIDSLGDYTYRLDAADAFATGQRFDLAQKWFDEAIALYPERMGGYTRKGFVSLNRGRDYYDEAEQAFRKALDVAPDSYSPYWAMGQLAEYRGNWEAAAEYYAEVIERQPEYDSNMRTRIGDMLWKSRDLETAEQTLIDALKDDPANYGTILGAADDYYKVLGRPEDALRLFGVIRETKGEDYEAAYRNRVGNVHYYNADYIEATRQYELACEADDGVAVYHANLAGAYRELKKWSDARNAYRKSFQIDGNLQVFERELRRVNDSERRNMEQMLAESVYRLDDVDAAIDRARAQIADDVSREVLEEHIRQLEALRDFTRVYGIQALTFDPVDLPIRAPLGSDLLSAILDDDEGDLSEQFKADLASLRERLQTRFGLSIPSFRFSEASDFTPQPRFVRVVVMGQVVSEEELGPSADDAGAVIGLLEAVVSRNVELLCTHDETVRLLEACGSARCASIANNPRRLTAFNGLLRRQLRDGQGVVEIQKFAEALSSSLTETGDGMPVPEPIEPAPGDVAEGITSIRLRSGAALDGATLSLEETRNTMLQQMIFDGVGVILPTIEVLEDPDLDADRRVMDLAGRSVEFVAGESNPEFESMLNEITPLFITRVMQSHVMAKLDESYPVLGRVARYWFPGAALTLRLRDHVSTGKSIRHLPGVLESLIQDAGHV